ncbi:MAG: hypothetical protein ACTSVI_04080 [Promethearchaeota archaeon]
MKGWYAYLKAIIPYIGFIIISLVYLFILVVLYTFNLFSMYLKENLLENLIYLRSITLCGGIIIFIFGLVKFIEKFRKKPNIIRLFVLMSLISFEVSAVFYFIVLTFEFNFPVIDSYYRNITNISMIFSVYFLVVFSLYILATPKNENKIKTFKILLDVSMIVIYMTLFLSEIFDVFGITNAFMSFMSNVGEYFLYIYGLFIISMLFLSAFKSISLIKKSGDAIVKKGLKYLGLSFFTLGIATVVEVINLFLLGGLKELILVFLILVVCSFYFIYNGFIKPNVK